MGVRIIRGSEVYDLGIVQDVRYMANTEVVEVPLPEEDKAWIFGLGGARLSLVVVSRVVSSQISSVVSALRKLITGRMMDYCRIVIDEWGIDEEGIVKAFEFSQKAGEPNVIDVRVEMLVGYGL